MAVYYAWYKSGAADCVKERPRGEWRRIHNHRRRRNSKTENLWGHMDISPPIRHDVQADLDKEIINSKYVLFYFIHVIAMDESKWRLTSCLPTLTAKDRMVESAKRRRGDIYGSRKLKKPKISKS